MEKLFLITVPAAGLMLALPAAAQTVRYVDGIAGDDHGGANTCTVSGSPCATINHALSLASGGGTIEIAAAAYTETLYIDKSITLQGAGESATIIQAHAQPGQATSRVITIDGDHEVEIVALTIRHGVGGLGGGGIYNNGATASLTNVTFNDNEASLGGGMYNDNDSSPTLTNVTFSGNNASQIGGGMRNNNGSSPVLTNVTFSGNAAVIAGGGMGNDNNSSPTLTNVTFNGNSTDNNGGGMLNVNSSPVLANVIFSGNAAGVAGGGMSNTSSSPVLANVTFSGNTAETSGGGMYNGNSFPVLTNVIIWNNQAGGSTETASASIVDVNGSESLISYSLIANSGGSDDWNGDIGTDGGNNIDAAPLFVETPALGETGNLHLMDGSPAIDAGDPDTDPLIFPTDEESDPVDLDDNPRFFGTAIDIGAYEWKPPVDEILSDRFEQ